MSSAETHFILRKQTAPHIHCLEAFFIMDEKLHDSAV